MGGSTLPLAPDAFSGRMLGKYEVLCRLSTGGMAEIFLASQRGLAGFRKLVVLKQILPDIKGEEEFVRMFLDEARVTAAFNHPNIAQVYDLDVADGELFLAMEFVQGATLVEVAKACRAANEPIPMGLSLASARDTALALHYAHTFTDPLGRPASVIHRDVAEKNIMVTYEGVTKLLDFGIAKNLARKSRTQVGMVKGTSGYMSPEQLLGEPLDARSDLFSLGVVLHECLTGLRLFHAKTPMEGAGAVLQGQVPPPSRTNKSVPPELDAIVLKALARKRDDRYASTLEFARALERAVGPLIWHPEQTAELIRRLFAERREQTRQLLMAGQALSGDATGEVRVSQIFALSSIQQPEPIDEDPGTQPGLPQITPALPAGRPAPALVDPPTMRSPPPAPPEPQAKSPTPPRATTAPRRLTTSATPVAPPAEAPAVRRAVFEPLPQKRAAATPAPVAEALPPPPPPPELPPEEPSRSRPPAWKDENATRAAPPEEPRSEGRGRTLPREPGAPRTAELRSDARLRPSRVDMRPHGSGSAAERLPAQEDEESTQQDVVSRPGRQRSTSSERVPPPATPAPLRSSQRRRVPTPPPARALGPVDTDTHSVRALQVEPEEESTGDTNETLLPESEEVSNTITAPSAEAPRKRARAGWLIALSVGMLLVAGLSVVVALKREGDLLALLSPSAPPEESGTQETASAPPKPAPEPPAPSPPTPTVPAPDPTVVANTDPEPPRPGEEVNPPATDPPTPDDATPAADPSSSAQQAPQAPAVVANAAPAGESIKKRAPVIKRTRRESKPAPEPAPESDWAPIGEKSPPEAPAESEGLLTLVTEPYAKVYLGRQFLGDTPLFKLSLPSGKHSLRLVGPDGQSRRLPVVIKPEETTAVRIALDKLAAQ